MRTQQWLDFCVGSGRALKRPFSSSKTSFKVVPGSKQHVLQLFGSTPTATPKKQEHVLAVLRSGLRWVKTTILCNILRVPREKAERQKHHKFKYFVNHHSICSQCPSTQSITTYLSKGHVGRNNSFQQLQPVMESDKALQISRHTFNRCQGSATPQHTNLCFLCCASL